MTTSRAQIEKKFDKHAEDFGITEPRGKAGFDQLEQAIRAQIDNPATIHINEPTEEMPRSSITTRILGSPSFRGRQENLSVDGASHQTKWQTFCSEVLFDEYESTSASGHLVLHPDHRPIH